MTSDNFSSVVECCSASLMKQLSSACVLPGHSNVYPSDVMRPSSNVTSTAPTQKLLGFGGDFLASARACRIAALWSPALIDPILGDFMKALPALLLSSAMRTVL